MSSTPPPDQPDQQPPSPAPNQPPTYEDWRSMRYAGREARRAQRAAWREQRRARRGSWGGGWGYWGWPRGGWISGAILILLGVIFLFQNAGALAFNNWWALFILIPAFSAFAAAWTMFAAGGRLTWLARQALIGGIILTAVALAFLFNLNWGLVLPILLILAGLALLLNVVLPG